MSQENLYTPMQIRTFSGRYINVTEIRQEDIFPIDIAMGLSRICRFGGHTKRIWTVADHSIWCMQRGYELEPNNRVLHLRLLLHDAHEAYLGDWPTPLVDAIEAYKPGFKSTIEDIKNVLQKSIELRFGLSGNEYSEVVKKIDREGLEYDWKNKVLNWTGISPLQDTKTAEVWLFYFKELIRTPVVIHP